MWIRARASARLVCFLVRYFRSHGRSSFPVQRFAISTPYPQRSTAYSFPMASPAVLAARAALASVDLSQYDAEQSRLMDERCILVDEQDNAIGAMDKKTCALCLIISGLMDS